MSQPDKLRHVSHPAKLVTEVVKYHSHVAGPGGAGDFLHQTLAVPDASVLQNLPATAVSQLWDSKQSSLSLTAALQPIKVELHALLAVECSSQGSH